MSLLRTAAHERWTAQNRPPDVPAHSAGRFRLRADGTSRFDRHFHDFDEFWFVAAGHGTLQVGDETLDIQPGDIVFTAAGLTHDVLAVTSGADLEVFWLSWALPEGATGEHLHCTPDDAVKHPVPGRAA